MFRGERKREACERYWISVSREIAMGCRCTTFAPPPKRSTTSRSGASTGEPLPCLCDSTVGATASGMPLRHRLPSRLPVLILELRAILLSLLPATSRGYADVAVALDPDLLTQEVHHGVLDSARLARFLGHTLKLHCAPMRDELVDQMVACVELGWNRDPLGGKGPAVARGLRMCFEILELMKLVRSTHSLSPSISPFRS
jgi:T-complex protein 11